MAAAMKQRKMEAATLAMQEGEKKLRTGLFKWKPDFFSAAPKFADAGRDFRAAGALPQAIDAYERAALASHESGSPFTAAQHLELAAQLVVQDKADGCLERAMGLYRRASRMFRLADNPDRSAEMLAKAAKMLQDTDPEAAVALLQEAAEILVDSDRAALQMETLRRLLNLLLRLDKYDMALEHVKRMEAAFAAANQPHNVHKMHLTEVLLWLAKNEYPSADRAFHRHMDTPGYLQAHECEAAESFLTAFRDFDEAKLNEAANNRTLQHVDIETVRLARRLKLAGTAESRRAAAAASAPSAGETGSAAAELLVRKTPAAPTEAADASAAGAMGAAGAAEEEEEKMLAAHAPESAVPAAAAPAPAPAAAASTAADEEEFDIC